jgi:hypothetical protein
LPIKKDTNNPEYNTISYNNSKNNRINKIKDALNTINNSNFRKDIYKIDYFNKFFEGDRKYNSRKINAINSKNYFEEGNTIYNTQRIKNPIKEINKYSYSEKGKINKNTFFPIYKKYTKYNNNSLNEKIIYNNNYLKEDKDFLLKKKTIEKRKKKEKNNNIFLYNLTNKVDRKTYSFYFRGEKNEDFFINHSKTLDKAKNDINRTKQILNYRNDYNSIINQLNSNLDTNHKNNSFSSHLKRNNSSYATPLYKMKTLFNRENAINTYCTKKYNGKIFQNYMQRTNKKFLSEYNKQNSQPFIKYKKAKTSIFPANPFDSINLIL